MRFGTLGPIPKELLDVILEYLSMRDIQALRCTSSGLRRHVGHILSGNAYVGRSVSRMLQLCRNGGDFDPTGEPIVITPSMCAIAKVSVEFVGTYTPCVRRTRTKDHDTAVVSMCYIRARDWEDHHDDNTAVAVRMVNLRLVRLSAVDVVPELNFTTQWPYDEGFQYTPLKLFERIHRHVRVVHKRHEFAPRFYHDKYA